MKKEKKLSTKKRSFLWIDLWDHLSSHERARTIALWILWITYVLILAIARILAIFSSINSIKGIINWAEIAL